MTNPQLAETVKAIVAEIAPVLRDAMPIDMRLWDVDRCAEYFGVSPDHFRKFIASRPNFPTPALDLNCGGKKRSLRWRPRDVMKWRG